MMPQLVEALNCPHCGAPVVFPEGRSATKCDFCGSSLISPIRTLSGKVEVADIHDDHVANEDKFEDSVQGGDDAVGVEPPEPYDPVKERLKDKRARLERQLEFYQSKSNISRLRP